MGKYILRRLWLMVPALIGVSLVVFAILRLLPGDPAIGHAWAWTPPPRI